MRILTIGNKHSTKVFSNLLCENKENLVFSTLQETNAHFCDIHFLNVSELKDFALANEIDLTILTDFECIDNNFTEEFHANGLSIFAPEAAGARICSSKSFAKKFMYRNKIKTPKFQIFDKIQLAFDYIQTIKYPIIIKPDEHCAAYGSTIVETYNEAKKTLTKFMEMGVKTTIVENYVSGKEITLYVISDGFNSFLLDFVSTKRNKYAYLGASFINEELLKKINENVINPTIQNLARSGSDYVGILGIDLIIDNFNNIFTLEYNPFFEDLDVELFTNSINIPFEKLFESALSGTLKDEFGEIKKDNKNYFSTILKSGEIKTTSGRTLNEARENILEYLDKDEISEICGWKF